MFQPNYNFAAIYSIRHVLGVGQYLRELFREEKVGVVMGGNIDEDQQRRVDTLKSQRSRVKSPAGYAGRKAGRTNMKHIQR